MTSMRAPYGPEISESFRLLAHSNLHNLDGWVDCFNQQFLQLVDRCSRCRRFHILDNTLFFGGVEIGEIGHISCLAPTFELERLSIDEKLEPRLNLKVADLA